MHSGRPCHWHVFCGKATGPGTWTLKQACKRYQQGVESSLLPFPVCTFSSVLLFNHILANMGNVLKTSAELWIHPLYKMQLSLRSSGLRVRSRAPHSTSRLGSFSVPLTSDWALTLLSVFSLHFIPSSNRCLSRREEKAWLSRGAWVFTTQADESLLWKWIWLSFQFSPLFSARDNPVFTAR